MSMTGQNASAEKPSEQRVGSEQQILIEYQISSDGQQLEGSEPGQPVAYQMGQGQWPIQLELAMFNEPIGTELNLHLAASEQAFGVADPERIIVMSLDDFPAPPQIGALLEFTLPNAEATEGQVLKISGDQVEVDFNHPYAGRDLSVMIKLVSIVLASHEHSDATESTQQNI